MSKAAVIYWSGTGNTQAMATAIHAGLVEQGMDARLTEVTEAPNDLAEYTHLALGCPSMGAEVLEESVFEPYYSAILPALAGKKVALFGSYGCGDGAWMRDWHARTQAAGAHLPDEGLIMQDSPDIVACQQYGRQLAAF